MEGLLPPHRSRVGRLRRQTCSHQPWWLLWGVCPSSNVRTVFQDLFTDDGYFTGPALTEDAFTRAEAVLGFRLPRVYLDVLRVRNGGELRRQCFHTDFPTSWAADHFAVLALRGIGGQWGIDSPSLGSTVLVAEWGYPDVGVVLFETPSGGHDTVMLDYTDCGADGEPAVAYVDEDRVSRRVAASLAQFLDGLTPCPEPSEVAP